MYVLYIQCCFGIYLHLFLLYLYLGGFTKKGWDWEYKTLSALQHKQKSDYNIIYSGLDQFYTVKKYISMICNHNIFSFVKST